MKLSRGTAFWSLALAVLLVAGVFLINLRAAQQKDEVAAPATTSTVAPAAAETAVETKPSTATATTATAPADPRFAVPEGSVTEKLAFIDKLTQPTTPFTSAEQANKYWSQAAAAMKTVADQVLGAKPTDAQASEAVQFKVEALRILAMLGDKDAEKERTEFLDACLKDPRFEVSSVVGPLRMIPKMRRWSQLDAADRTTAINNLIADVKAAGPTTGQAQLLLGMADSLSDSPDRGLAARAVDQLLPTFRNGFQDNKDPAVMDMVSTLEGLNRRLRLPGNKLELEGTLLDGQPLDWEAYRGKVVLVDFWASWCPECLKEVPNILDNYQEYHDKGFEVIGICLDNDRRLAEQFVRQTGMTWPQLFTDTPPGNGWTHSLAEKYAIMGIPRAILVDQQGNVVSMMARGPMLHAYLQKLLGPADQGATSAGSNSTAPQTPATAVR